MYYSNPLLKIVPEVAKLYAGGVRETINKAIARFFFIILPRGHSYYFKGGFVAIWSNIYACKNYSYFSIR
tara:strand:- start:1436 stop:1645 length:210 start_codon:yes stop_codon:yes gene_type:complete